MRLIPHPPALDERRKTKQSSAGSLKRLTSFCRLLMLVPPSRRQNGYRLFLQSVWIKSRVCV